MYWDPLDEMREFQKRMNKTFESFFSKPETKKLSTRVYNPFNDIADKGDSFLVRVDLPGVEKEDIILNLTNINIEIRAQKKHELKLKKKNYYKHEKSYGGFYRVIPFPSSIDPDSAEAVYKKGVLYIKVKKSKTKKAVKKVKVE